jgi:hypothetical protein
MRNKPFHINRKRGLPGSINFAMTHCKIGF